MILFVTGPIWNSGRLSSRDNGSQDYIYCYMWQLLRKSTVKATINLISLSKRLPGSTLLFSHVGTIHHYFYSLLSPGILQSNKWCLAKKGRSFSFISESKHTSVYNFLAQRDPFTNNSCSWLYHTSLIEIKGPYPQSVLEQLLFIHSPVVDIANK